MVKPESNFTLSTLRVPPSVSSWNCFTTLQGFLQLSASLGGRVVGPDQLSDRGLAETQAEGESKDLGPSSPVS